MMLLWAALLLLSQEAVLEKGGVRLSLDPAPSFGPESLERARKEPGGVRIGRISFAKPGWFMTSAVPAGDYRLVVDAPRRSLRLGLRSEKGDPVASDSFWIDPPDASFPTPDLGEEEGAVVVTLVINGARLSWRWVPKDRLEAAATGVRRTGRFVELSSDLERPELEAALLQELEASVPVQLALLGREAPADPIRLYLFREEKKYAAVDQLVTGGKFRRNGGFASPLTRQAYIWYGSRTDPPDLEGILSPLILRATLLHEFNHVLCYTLRPGCGTWPNWLLEGLAEEAASASLRARNPADDDAFREYMKGRWRHAESVGSLPALDDLLGAYAGSDLGGWYSSAFTLVSRLGPERIRGLLDAASRDQLSTPCALAAREFLDLQAGGARTLWNDCRRELLRGAAPPLSVSGQTDRSEDGFRMTCAEGGSGRLILQERTYGPDVTLEARIAWQPCGERQADFYLAYSAGSDVVSFLKVAVLPRRIVLFRYLDRRWFRWGEKDFPEALEESGARKVWHPVTLTLKGRERRVGVVAGAHRAEFALPEYVPGDETRVGIGVYNSTVTFSDLRAK